MKDIKIVSFDVEGTLVTTDFSYAIWFEAIPERYAERYGVDFEQAKNLVEDEYQKVGDQRLEWYDIKYWFDKLDLGLPYPVMDRYQNRVCYYPDTKDILASLHGKYKLTVASGSPHNFLYHLLRDINPYFSEIFSSVSDYKQLKTPEFYTEMCQAMKIRPEQLVHVGDNRRFDFIAPSEIGINAFHLDRKKQADHEDSLTSLTQLKVHLLD